MHVYKHAFYLHCLFLIVDVMLVQVWRCFLIVSFDILNSGRELVYAANTALDYLPPLNNDHIDFYTI